MLVPCAGVGGDADAGVDHATFTAQAFHLGDAFDDTVAEMADVFAVVQVWADQGELVTAQARYGVAVACQLHQVVGQVFQAIRRRTRDRTGR